MKDTVEDINGTVMLKWNSAVKIVTKILKRSKEVKASALRSV